MSSNTAAMPLRPAMRYQEPFLGGLLASLGAFFSRRKPVAAHGADRDSSAGLSRMEATRPYVNRRDQERVDAAGRPNAGAVPRRSERLVQRELVFQLVRESMVRAGVLSSGYKFKVLALDKRGSQFMVMMDLAAEFGGQTERLAEIEALIAQSAKYRHNILVQAVYWRFNEHVVLGKPARPATTVHGAIAAAEPAAALPQVAPIRLAPVQRYEPLLEDELAAFKRAIEAGSAPIAAKAAGLKSSGLLLTGYEDTEVADENEGMPVLSTTQYGDLPIH